jgi:hypothetical protein
MRVKWWMHSVYIYENRRMKPVEIVVRKRVRRKRVDDGGDKSS